MPIVELNEDMSRVSIEPYGELEPINDVLSKARVRIFYKGLNRNRTFISDEFAIQLEQSLPYTPIKGIYDSLDEDFTDHGEDNCEGRIYGIVPENPNAVYEEHTDIDGIVRSYLCCDVYLFTGLYQEAQEILGKSQSMEIFRETMDGEWRIADDGQPMFYFTKGCFVGLQVLGIAEEPCFEGSAFFNLCKDIQGLTEYIRKIEEQEENKVMEKANFTNFRLSDNQKFSLIFAELNKNVAEDAQWPDYQVIDVFDEYALCYNFKTDSYERVSYTKDDSSVTLGEITTCFMIDVTESEFNALQAMKSMNEGSYENLNENFAKKEDPKEEDEKEDSKDDESKDDSKKDDSKKDDSKKDKEDQEEFKKDDDDKKGCNSSLMERVLIEERDRFAAQIQELENEKTEFQKEKENILKENEELLAFKKQIESEKKDEIINQFDGVLEEDVLDRYKLEKDNFTVEDLEKDMCLTAYKANPNVFSKKQEEEVEAPLVFKNSSMKSESELSGCERLILKHKKIGGNK